MAKLVNLVFCGIKYTGVSEKEADIPQLSHPPGKRNRKRAKALWFVRIIYVPLEPPCTVL